MKINLAAIKRAYKSIPHPLNAPLLYVPFELFCGSNYRTQLKALQEYDRLSNDEKRHLANRALVQYLNEAIQYTPFFREFANREGIKSIESPQELYRFPVIDKDTVMKEGQRLYDTRYVNQRYQVSTGGTTGSQLHFYIGNDCYAREWAFVSHFLSKHSISLNTRRLCLRGVDGIDQDSLIGYNPLYKEQLVSPFRMSATRVKSSLNEIKQFKPRWIHGYPSSVADFANLLKTIGEDLPSVQGVLLVSEKFNEDQRRTISSVFGDNIATFYGLSERVIFAEEHTGAFFPHQLYGVTELIDGELVGTGFLNGATRLIRYRTGDAAQADGHPGRIDCIDDITGRRGCEFLLGKSGEHITMTALNTHSDLLNYVRRYQFFQSEPGKCTLRLMIDKDFDQSMISPISKLFQNKVGDSLFITSQVVPDIPLTSRGKHRYIISTINEHVSPNPHSCSRR